MPKAFSPIPAQTQKDHCHQKADAGFDLEQHTGLPAFTCDIQLESGICLVMQGCQA